MSGDRFGSYEDTPADYGWTITEDKLAEAEKRAIERGEAPGWLPLRSDVGTVGPRNVSPEIEAALKAGEGRAFRLLDDDGEVYYYGRILYKKDQEPFDHADFGPLWDFGGPNAGATDIQYFEAGRGWVSL